MENAPRMTGPTLKVLSTFLTSPKEELSGAQIGRETKLATGTLYPILLRLEGADWLRSRWEGENPSALGRPRRRLYRITPLGEKNAKSAFKELVPGQWRPAWA
jgi:PadR family transcriptional regulator